MTTRLTNEQIDAIVTRHMKSSRVGQWRQGCTDAVNEALDAQAALASPAEGMPAEPMRYDIDQSEDGGGLSAGGEDYVSSADYDALRAAASSILAENQRLKESVADLQGQLNAIANEYYD